MWKERIKDKKKKRRGEKGESKKERKGRRKGRERYEIINLKGHHFHCRDIQTTRKQNFE